MLWLGALSIAVVLVFVQLRIMGRFMWVAPYPKGIKGLLLLVSFLMREAPWAFVGLVIIPCAVVVVTLYWAIK
jgi:hypothetical protein